MAACTKRKDSYKGARSVPRFLIHLAGLAVVTLGGLSFGITSCAVAQEPTATETKDVRSQTTIKTTVRQVLVDVVVTDRKNHPITDLRREDFYVLEDGHPQSIAFFEAHSSRPDSEAEKLVALPDLPPNTFANASTPGSNLPLNVLLYDLLNTPLTDQPFAHKEIVKFLQNRPAGSRFAIFVLGDTLRLLQGFTDDERQLVAAMNRKEANPHSTLLYQPPGSLSVASAVAQETLDRMQSMEAATRRFYLTRRVERTIGAFEEIAKFLSGLPGRKNLIWLSGSFPANVFPSNDVLDPFGPANFSGDLRQAADLLTVGQVAVYPVDIQGLTTDPVYDASNPESYRTPQDFLRAHMNFMLEIAAEQATMDEIADDTGGHAFYNTNGLSDAIATGTEDGSSYYTLAYSPSNTKFDGRKRKIRVQLYSSSGGYHLAYRHSYLADDSVVERNVADAATMRLQVALRRGGPLTRELPLQVHITPQGRAKGATKEEIAQLAQFPAYASRKKWEGLRIQRYSIEYEVAGSQVGLESTEDGGFRARFEILMGVYDAESRTMFGYRSPLEKVYLVKNADQMRKESFRLRHTIEIPGEAAWLRVAVHDVIGDHLGSVEIPLPLRVKLPVKTSEAAR